VRSLKLQFFLLYGSVAASQPFIALYLIERGMGASEVGFAVGMSGWAIMLSPVLVTLLADTRWRPRVVVAAVCGAASLALGAMLLSEGFWSLTAFFFLYSLGFVAVMPLLDGISFGLQEFQAECGARVSSYSAVRVWGTYGYIALHLLLFYPVLSTEGLALPMWTAALCTVLLAINALWLPDRGSPETSSRAGLPTRAAFYALFSGRMLAFSAGIFFLQCCSAAYHTMYPVFLVEYLSLETHWVSIVLIFGAFIEVLFILLVPKFQARWGASALMRLFVALALLRFGLMYLFPNLWVGVGTQLLHGPMICAMMILPPIIVNGAANESSRYSIQGVYTMVILGSSRLLGTAVSGLVGEVDQNKVNLMCAGLCLAAFLLLALGGRGEGSAVQPGSLSRRS